MGDVLDSNTRHVLVTDLKEVLKSNEMVTAVTMIYPGYTRVCKHVYSFVHALQCKGILDMKRNISIL